MISDPLPRKKPLTRSGAILISLALPLLASQNIPDEKPNIVLIMGDDMGFSDLGCYGSEINTPHLDRLGYQGVRFKHFYNMAKCNPTRSSLLTGFYRLDDRKLTRESDKAVVPIAELMRRAGYTTIICGKDHYDPWTPAYCHAENSFDKSFVYWAIAEYFIPPSGKFRYPFKLNGRKLSPKSIPVKQHPFYKTDVITDFALKWMDESLGRKEPFFLYLPYHVAHYPLQAREEGIRKYRGRYLIGWDKIREQRLKRMKLLGIVERDCKMSPPTGIEHRLRGHPRKTQSHEDRIKSEKIRGYQSWEALTENEKEEMDLEMAVLAAMVDRMDQNIGRVINKLENAGALDNTLIIFLSDNGGCPYDSNSDFNHPPGGAASYRSLCASWANAQNTPYRYFKWAGHEGGCNTHFIAHWPGVIPKGHIANQPGHVVDIIPTFLDILNETYPAKYNGRPTIPLHGKSLLPILKEQKRKAPDFFISGLGEGFRMFRHKNWKITRWNEETRWELFDLDRDPTELNDLATSRPEKVVELSRLYAKARKQIQWGISP